MRAQTPLRRLPNKRYRRFTGTLSSRKHCNHRETALAKWPILFDTLRHCMSTALPMKFNCLDGMETLLTLITKPAFLKRSTTRA